jgi:hypothetical protein
MSLYKLAVFFRLSTCARHQAIPLVLPKASAAANRSKRWDIDWVDPATGHRCEALKECLPKPHGCLLEAGRLCSYAWAWEAVF